MSLFVIFVSLGHCCDNENLRIEFRVGFGRKWA
jgi:hypothetical protein